MAGEGEEGEGGGGFAVLRVGGGPGGGMPRQLRVRRHRPPAGPAAAAAPGGEAVFVAGLPARYGADQLRAVVSCASFGDASTSTRPTRDEHRGASSPKANEDRRQSGSRARD